VTNGSVAEHLLDFRNSCYSGCESKFEDLLGQDIYPRLLGRLLSQFAIAPNSGKKYEKFIDEIPTETTIGERKFLFNFFAQIWKGHYQVLEIGSFLGGSTRAIASGMQVNPNRLDRSKLHTFDKFENYYNPDRLLSFLAPLFENGSLKEEVCEQIKRSSDFLDIFRLIHQEHEYYPLIKQKRGVLPDQVEDTANLENIFKLPPGLMLDAVFVDGCKSWYGTKYFMREISACVLPGSYFIFQDYGAFTCFWIPVLVAMMQDYFKLVAYVDNTYTFRLTKHLDVQEMDQRFPDTPELVGKSNFDLIFSEMLKTAMDWNDTFTLVNYHLQHAAALAYIGERTEARSKIVELLKRPEFSKYRSWILMSLNVPTYRPVEGNIYL